MYNLYIVRVNMLPMYEVSKFKYGHLDISVKIRRITNLKQFWESASCFTYNQQYYTIKYEF